ncbi:restriction endonuclease subunit S [Escherichia coli]|nr:restriction endonuclease subunit S [Escherichia coli]
MVPKGWMLKQLSDIVKEKISYGIVQAGPHIPNGIPYIKSSDIRGAIDPASLQRTAPEIHYKYRRSAVHPGDIIFSLRGNIGETAIVPSNLLEANLTQGTARISVSGDQCNEFYHQQFAMDKLRNYINSLSKGSTFKEISLEELRKVKVLCAPLPEQKKIAQILSTWDNAISVTEKLLTNSQQQKKALMQQLLTGKKRLLDERGVRFSGEWEYTIFGNLGDTYTGLTGKTKEDFGAGKPYIPYINIFKNSRIDIQNLEYVQVNDDERQSVVKYGDIFFTTSSETPEEVGMSSVLLEEVSEVFLNSFCFGFRLNNFETLIPKYARYLFRSEHVRRQISTLGQGATRYNLSKRQLIKLELKLPCVEEQQKIAAVLSAADAEISTLEKKLACLRDEKKALMQQLLTGKRRVKVDEAVAE